MVIHYRHADRALSSDARGVGPLRLSVVPRSGSEAGEVIAFLPQRDPGWGARFAELLHYRRTLLSI